MKPHSFEVPVCEVRQRLQSLYGSCGGGRLGQTFQTWRGSLYHNEVLIFLTFEAKPSVVALWRWRQPADTTYF
jgi:hypothetical protein